MTRRTFAHRFAAYVAVLLLVLRAGAPMLAADAARWRDVPLGEICTAYGFSAPGVEAAQPGPGGAGSRDESPGGSGAHGHEECALAALAALSSPPPAAVRRVRGHSDRGVAPSRLHGALDGTSQARAARRGLSSSRLEAAARPMGEAAVPRF
jgi:hypothetical protein